MTFRIEELQYAPCTLSRWCVYVFMFICFFCFCCLHSFISNEARRLPSISHASVSFLNLTPKFLLVVEISQLLSLHRRAERKHWIQRLKPGNALLVSAVKFTGNLFISSKKQLRYFRCHVDFGILYSICFDSFLETFYLFLSLRMLFSSFVLMEKIGIPPTPFGRDYWSWLKCHYIHLHPNALT